MILQIPSGVRVLVPHVSGIEILLVVIVVELFFIFLLILEAMISRRWK